MRRSAILLLLSLLSLPSFAAANPHLDLDFEAPDCAGGWFMGGQSYRPRFIVDLRNIPADSPAAPGLAESRPFRSIGAMAMKCAFGPSVVASDYDGLIYIDKTSPSVLLR